uniref:Phosphatidylcholine transfer protein n=1 Tax=Dracunculus medinensis TaxID=318479 RepID=A0A0N4U396_DRAME
LRRLHNETGLYEYKCSGSYRNIRDVCARDFIDAQIDLDYRKSWDPNAITLELLNENIEECSETVRWIVKFPFPFYPREYIFLRQRCYDAEKVVISSSAVGPEQYPSTENCVRVTTYQSIMIVNFHGTIDDKGLDYILTYYENPECNLPSYIYNWVVNSAGPFFLQRAYNAAKELEIHRKSFLNDNESDVVDLNELSSRSFLAESELSEETGILSKDSRSAFQNSFVVCPEILVSDQNDSSKAHLDNSSDICTFLNNTGKEILSTDNECCQIGSSEISSSHKPEFQASQLLYGLYQPSEFVKFSEFADGFLS